MVKILKIGGSIITDKSKSSCPRSPEIVRISKEIASSPSGLVLVHGAGSFGHMPAKKYGLPGRFSPEGVRVTHASVLKLNEMVVEALSRAGANPVPVSPFNCTVLRSGRIKSMELSPLKEMLRRGMLPVLHGDVAMDSEKGAGIVSGDQLVSYLSRNLKAEIAAIGTNVDGVILDGRVLRVVTEEDFSSLKFGPGSGVDVTGGMKGKLKELLDLAGEGTESQIFNASRPGQIERAIQGEHIGTAVRRSR